MTRLSTSCTLAALGLLSIAFPLSAQAQLLSEQVRDTLRVCTYAGTETLIDGQVVPLTYVTGIGQECPVAAPHRDPNAPVPPNAQLTGERTTATNRVCLYSEAGLEYQVAVDVTLRCAMTPALMERDGQDRQAGLDTP